MSIITGLAVATVVVLLPVGPSLPADNTARKSAAVWSALLAGCLASLLYAGNIYVAVTATYLLGEERITHQGSIEEDGPIAGEVYDETLRQELRENRAVLIWELFLRRLVLPPWQQSCFAGQVRICQLADQLNSAPGSAPGAGWLVVLPGLLAGLVGGLSVWFIAIPQGLLRALGFRRRSPATPETAGVEDILKVAGWVPPEQRRRCPHCDETISRDMSRCQWCGAHLDRPGEA